MTHKVVLEITSKKLFTLFSPFTSWYRFCRNTIYLIVLKKNSIGILVISFKMADFFWKSACTQYLKVSWLFEILWANPAIKLFSAILFNEWISLFDENLTLCSQDTVLIFLFIFGGSTNFKSRDVIIDIAAH